ncbi:MAG: ATP-binding protein, partial [Oscillospiraceae bacterium]|nr:ATP-binding protein [Oscillospiraceae bacterium]
DKSRSQDKGGTGLGLYIVKMLTSAMGGTVEVDSDGESYTRFTITLQTAPTSREKNSKATKPEKGKTRASRSKKTVAEGHSPRLPWGNKR